MSLILTWYTWANTMADPITWYALGKSVDDETTIEEQIDADILTHNIDPSAHGQVDEAIEVHRVDDEIDHPDGSISLKKLVNDKFVVIPSFESLDGWDVVGLATAGVFGARVYTTNVANNESFLWFEGGASTVELKPAKDPFFQTTVILGATTTQEAFWGCGTEPGNLDRDSFGFKVVNNTLSARWTDGAGEHTQAIAGITLTDNNVYRCELNSTDSEIYFYVNGTLKYTATVNFPSTDNDFIFTYWIKTTDTVVRNLRIIDCMWMQDR